MDLQECYERLKGDYSLACSLLVSDQRVEKFMLKYPKDGSVAELHRALEANDMQAAFAAAHTLKGVAGNLAFTQLQQAASDLTEQLRPLPDFADPQLVAAVDGANELVVNAIEAYQQQ